jgi:transcriptional regulator with XRE-family HTH domain
MPKPSATAVFAERLRAIRTKAGISQANLGERIGLTFEVASTRINRYERGKHPPDLETAERLADELGVPLAYFVTRDAALAEAILGFAGLSRERKASILKAIRAEAEAQASSAANKASAARPPPAADERDRNTAANAMPRAGRARKPAKNS